MGLPSGYKRLEYIQSSGTQYIDMGFKATENTKIEAKFHNEQSANSAVFGADKAWTQDAFGIWINNTIAVPVVGTVSGTIGVSYSSAYDTFTLDKNTLKLNGGTIWTASGVSAFQTPTNVCLGAVNRSGNVSEKFVGKMYYCKVWENGTLIRDFIPCRTPDGTVGLWDNINSVFYTNAGTGAFIGGPLSSVSLPSGYRRLEYIQSSGTQYIDTGIVPKNNTRVDADCDITYGTGWIMILGSYDYKGYFSWWANATQIYAYYGSQNKSGNGATGKQTMIANGNKWSASANSFVFSDESFIAPSTMYLFSVHNSGNGYANASMKLYACQIYDDGTLVRDFVPCQTTAGEIGLWDDVNSVFYGNAGTGTFTAGPAVASPSIFVNIDGIWKPINHIYVNINNIWQKST